MSESREEGLIGKCRVECSLGTFPLSLLIAQIKQATAHTGHAEPSMMRNAQSSMYFLCCESGTDDKLNNAKLDVF